MSSDLIHDIRREGERFLRGLNRELYENLAGLKKGSNLKGIYKSHSDLADPGLFFSVKSMSSQGDEEGKSLRLILSFLARFVIESKTARIRDEILAAEAKEEIQIDRTTIPYRAAAAEIKREPKRARREGIDKRRIEKVLKLNPLILELLDVTHGASAELGFSGFANLCDEVEKLNLAKLEDSARLFLGDTEYVYRDLLKWFLLKRMEVQLKDAREYDLSYLFNSFELRANFLKTDLRALARTSLNGTGLEVGDNVKTDLEERRGKASGALCFPVEVTRDIIISMYPIGGVEDYESFFCQLGIALSYAYSGREDEFEFRRLRDASSRETFGFLFQSLHLQPKWLRKYLKLDTGGDFLKFLYLRQLMAVRYYSGKLIYEIALHADEDFRGKSDLYKEILKHATLCEHSKADYLNGVDPFFGTASRLKACVVGAGLRLYLRENFDEEWWRVREAGDFIRSVWKEGGRITSEEICKRAGFPEFSLLPLFGFFREVLG